MKTFVKYIFLVVVILATSCNNDFMDRFPETSISPENFFRTVEDLELYTNTYYGFVSPQFCDYVSDNCVSYAEISDYNKLIRGEINPATVWGWSDWGTLRHFNFFLKYVYNATGDPAQINHHIGLTRLQRAIWYYDMVKKYNDVPWYSVPLTDTDTDLLYKKRDPRTLVVDSIMADLDYAVKNISEDIGNRTQFSRWYALAMQARICLHEGTFRKYHDELNLQNTANTYLEKAVSSTQEIMKSNLFFIDKTGGKEKAYWNLFSSYSLSKSPEMILFKDYDKDAHIKHGGGVTTFSWVTNLSRSLMESYEYLTEDGKAIPFTSVKDYEKMGFVDVFKNRDPRFSQTFMYPGYVKAGENISFRPNMNLGGYPQIKFMPETADQITSRGDSYTDLPVSRYAEILLIYAEAKAELGKLNQEDMNQTINEIRSRVNMPPVIISQLADNPSLKSQYPNISDKALLEIRRERRIELISENFRWDDLMRWKAGHLIEQMQQGAYIPQLGLFDVSGDGVPDVGIYKNEAGNPVPESERSNYTFYYLENSSGVQNTFSLSKGDSGYIIMNGEIGKRIFKQPQFYYWPIPQIQRQLNPNLEETIFWGN